MSDLKTIVQQIFSAEGALIEHIEPDGLEILSPPRLQQDLSIPELMRVGFGSDLPVQAMRINLESDWLEKLENLMAGSGKSFFLDSSIIDNVSYPSNPQRILERKLILDNAIFRFNRQEKDLTTYSVLIFRYSAISDEKREDIYPLVFNESNNLFAEGLYQKIFSHLFQTDIKKTLAENKKIPIKMKSQQTVIENIHPIIKKAIRAGIADKISPFIDGMKKRLDRDLGRIHKYYNDLRKEIAQRAIMYYGKKQDNDKIKVAQMKADAVKLEYQAKLSDLRRKYSMRVEIEQVQSFRLILPVSRIYYTVYRRKASRQQFVDWNLLSRKIDTINCQSCYQVPASYLVCDAKLHLVCNNCLGGCSGCGKDFCKACYPKQCPNCKSEFK